MERRARFRIWLFVVLIFAVVGLFTFRLYKLQSVQDEESLRTADSYTYDTTVYAARGQLLDRNGTMLVTNRASYNLVIITYPLFSSGNEKMNAYLLSLLRLCQELGIETTSHLPVTRERPYAYNLEDYDDAWQGYFRRFLRSRSWDTDITAQTLMYNLRHAYEIPDDWSDEDIYDLIRIRYELSLRAVQDMPLGNYTLAQDISAEDLAAIMELGIPGVTVETTTVREYKTPYAAHLLGHIRAMDPEQYEKIYKALDYPMDAKVGQEGVELAFEKYLHGTDGTKRTVVTADGEVLSQYYLETPEPGGNVELSIDINLQAVAETALEAKILALRESGVGRNQEGMDAKGGAVVVTDVKTGEILACANYPTYDLSTYHQNFTELAADKNEPLLNRAMMGLYPPGSIYKMVTAITAMEYANVGPYFQVRDEGRYMKYADLRYTPACHIYTSTGATHGTVNMMQAISVSCNYYFYEVGLKIATKDLDYVAMKLGLGEPTGSELPENTGARSNEETKAQVMAGTDETAWVDGDKLQGAIGQGFNQFTPLQMACYTAALANQGARYKATFLRRVVSWDYKDLIAESQPEILSRLDLDEETLACIQEGMTMAASTGTAATFFSDYPIAVAAKTGTAQHGSGGSDNASFVCYAPADDPQIAIAIYVERGAQGGNLGEIARAIMDAYFSQESKYETVSGENTLR